MIHIICFKYIILKLLIVRYFEKIVSKFNISMANFLNFRAIQTMNWLYVSIEIFKYWYLMQNKNKTCIISCNTIILTFWCVLNCKTWNRLKVRKMSPLCVRQIESTQMGRCQDFLTQKERDDTHLPPTFTSQPNLNSYCYFQIDFNNEQILKLCSNYHTSL